MSHITKAKTLTELQEDMQQESIDKLKGDLRDSFDTVYNEIKNQGYYKQTAKKYSYLWGRSQLLYSRPFYKENDLQVYYLEKEKVPIEEDLIIVTPLVNSIMQDYRIIHNLIMGKLVSNKQRAVTLAIVALLLQFVLRYNVPIIPNGSLEVPLFLAAGSILFTWAVVLHVEIRRLGTSLSNFVLHERLTQERSET